MVWRQANADHVREMKRDGNLRANYGISLEDYRARYFAQAGLCALCGQPEQARVHGRVRWLCVDYDHTAGRVRGLLCLICNTLLGKANEDPDLIRAAITYLEKAEAAPCR
jgi:hypothetical protein